MKAMPKSAVLQTLNLSPAMPQPQSPSQKSEWVEGVVSDAADGHDDDGQTDLQSDYAPTSIVHTDDGKDDNARQPEAWLLKDFLFMEFFISQIYEPPIIHAPFLNLLAVSLLQLGTLCIASSDPLPSTGKSISASIPKAHQFQRQGCWAAFNKYNTYWVRMILGSYVIGFTC